MDSIVTISGLKKYFPIKSTSLFGKRRWTRAIDGIDLEIQRGEALGVVGESGSGKTTLGKLILGLHSPTDGTIDCSNRGDGSMNLSVVFQDPFSSLNPRMTVFNIIKEPLEVGRRGQPKADYRATIVEAMKSVGLSEEQLFRYPHEFSGGQRQRIAIARAIVSKPLFIVFDEPTSGLDVSVQAQILNLLRELKTRIDLSYVFISHNLGVIRYICTRIAVMYRGKIVEIAENRELFDNPMHPYTQHLLSAVPVIDEDRDDSALQIAKDRPRANDRDEPQGCIYYGECPLREPRCREQAPLKSRPRDKHDVYCWLSE
ncbi:MAG TPA: ABC transporter ATP-binding protein [Spirochaetia bacterium]|nr:ABC transporter ATP-binding protein [Spirochaetia bacterium]